MTTPTPCGGGLALSDPRVVLDYPVNALTSFHYFGTANIAEMASWGLRIIGDSGAFSADASGQPITADDLYEWAYRWRDSFVWVASLDVIGDPRRSWDNWVNSPSDLKMVPTVHYGADPTELRRYVDRGADLIGLGGMVPFKSEPERLLRWCLSMMRYARDNFPHVRFHGWGVTHPILLNRLPWWSVDSSGFGSGYRYGRLTLFDPDLNKKITVQMDGKQAARHASLIRRHYGISWRDVAVSIPENRPVVIRTAMRTMQLVEESLRRKHRVSAPDSVASKYLPRGPHIHYADTARDNFRDGTHIHTAHATHVKDYQPVAAKESK